MNDTVLPGNQSLLIYESNQGSVEVSLTGDTLWLSQKEMATVFDVEVPAISKHISNILKEKELSSDSTVSKMERAQQEGKRQVRRQVEVYHLDMIISVGYRVNSGRATHFRQWATTRLREHLEQGYTLNEQRLQHHQQQLKQLEHTLALFQNKLIEQANLGEAKGLLSVITDYARTFVLLNQFDSERLPTADFSQDIRFEISYEIAREAIDALINALIQQGEATELVGNEKDDSFAGILGNIVQSFGGEYLYPSIEEQAAHLLYFIIKNHPFSDGNKRIGAFLFIWFLQANQHHLKRNGELKINDNALAAIALLVAQSVPEQKNLMIQLIMNLIRTA